MDVISSFSLGINLLAPENITINNKKMSQQMMRENEKRNTRHTFAKIRDNFQMIAKVWTGRVSLFIFLGANLFFVNNLGPWKMNYNNKISSLWRSNPKFPTDKSLTAKDEKIGSLSHFLAALRL